MVDLCLVVILLLSASATIDVNAWTWTQSFVEHRIEENLVEHYSDYYNSAWDGEQTRKRFVETGVDPIVKLAILDHNVVMDNGFVRINLTKPDGLLSEIYYYNSSVNLLQLIEEDGGGYWDTVWLESNGSGQTGRRGIFDIIKGTEFLVIKQDENQIELSFKRTWDPSRGQGLVPLNIDKRFIMLSGSHGFYSYEILEHLQGWPAFAISEFRLALKLNGDKFHYMAISDEVKRVMPTSEDRRTGRALDYPEAVLLTNPSNPELKGEVDDKYQYSMEAEDSHVHGWISDELNLGLWMITPSNEFRNGGPNKRELTSHVGPTTLAVFLADHYLGGANVEISDGEPWKKVLGPVFVYLNRAIGVPDPRGMLWDNAKTQMRTELQSWPYSFPMSEDFPHSDRRGSVSGRLLVHDRFVHKESKPANSAYVGLARPGVAGSWQTEGKGYQFWTRTNADGVFSINNVREGKYSLYAWVPGFIGDFKYEVDLDIAPGHHINLGGIVYEPPRDGRTLWEIGIPDRSAAEFYIPNPSPKYINKAFLVPERRKSSHPVDKFKQYGLWERYAELYPDRDLVYTVGASDYTKDWFYAQVTRKNKDNTFRPTTWQIVFHLQSVVSYGTYKLRLALASATLADLQVRVNSSPSDPPLLQTRMIGRDNAIARHGIHGVYWLFHVDVPSFCLVAGKNTIYLYQSISTGPFEGVMYDYLRLEAPSEMEAFMKSG